MERRQNQNDAPQVPIERPLTPGERPPGTTDPETPGQEYPDENPEPRKAPEPSRQWE